MSVHDERSRAECDSCGTDVPYGVRTCFRCSINEIHTHIIILGKGFIGNHIKSHFDINSNPGIKVTLLSKSDLDYTNEFLLEQYIERNRNFHTYIVNASGYTGTPNVDSAELEKELCWKYNLVAPIKISRVCEKLNVDLIHITSGCIYSGDKQFHEYDTPNFGLYDYSSFYSKSKHAFETTDSYGMNIRIRMPITATTESRNYLMKILKYDNLINFKNSKTYIPDLCRFIEYIVNNQICTKTNSIINFVNPSPLFTEEIIDILTSCGLHNPNWRIVENINTAAPRSNCTLSISKLNNIYPEFKIQREDAAVKFAAMKLSSILHDKTHS